MLHGMCMFSQVPNLEKKSYKKTIIAETVNETSLVSPDLDYIWKDSYEYVIIMPGNASLKTYNKLQVMLLNPEYTRGNTLVFCSSGCFALTKEACGGKLPVYDFLGVFIKNDSKVRLYSIRKIKDENYDYRLMEKTVD